MTNGTSTGKPEENRFQTIEDINEVNIWMNDMDGGKIRVLQQQGDFVAEVNGDMLVIEEQ